MASQVSLVSRRAIAFKASRIVRLFREVLPAEGEAMYPRRFDLLIVDEAHNERRTIGRLPLPRADYPQNG